MSAEAPKPSRGQRDPEFLARMREKAAAKKAELKAIRDAEIVKAKQEHAAKLAQARKVLGGGETELEPEPVPAPEPEPSKPRKVKAKPPPEPESGSETGSEDESPPPRARRAPKARATPAEATQAINWKQVYYQAKLERMLQPPPAPAPSPQATNGSHIHQAVRQDIVTRANRRMLDDLMKEYWPHD